MKYLCAGLVILLLVGCDAKDRCLDDGGRYDEASKQCVYEQLDNPCTPLLSTPFYPMNPHLIHQTHRRDP